MILLEQHVARPCRVKREGLRSEKFASLHPSTHHTHHRPLPPWARDLARLRALRHSPRVHHPPREVFCRTRSHVHCRTDTALSASLRLTSPLHATPLPSHSLLNQRWMPTLPGRASSGMHPHPSYCRTAARYSRVLPGHASHLACTTCLPHLSVGPPLPASLIPNASRRLPCRRLHDHSRIRHRHHRRHRRRRRRRILGARCLPPSPSHSPASSYLCCCP